MSRLPTVSARAAAAAEERARRVRRRRRLCHAAIVLACALLGIALGAAAAHLHRGRATQATAAASR